ncbi:MAG: MFS transporter [Deltaproteobacteria bacterium]|nr:MFS transporter [Deltaproteobacteria bacterium]
MAKMPEESVNMMSEIFDDASSRRYSSPLRWLSLITVSFAVFGAYYAYDTISPARRVLETELGFGPSSFSWLVAIYSLPNLLGITLLGGIIADRRGIRFAGKLFITLTLMGSLITAFGVSSFFRTSHLAEGIRMVSGSFSPEFIVMFIGRFIFGMGAEVLIVTQEKVIVRWFKGRELGLAFGIGLLICRIGTIAAFIVSTRILDSTRVYTMLENAGFMMMVTDKSSGLETVIWLGAVIMLLSTGSFMLYTLVEKTYSRKHSMKESNFSGNHKGGSILNVLKSKPFIWISLLCFSFYSAVFPFTSFATDILQSKFGISISSAGFYTSLVMTSTIIGTPFFGYIVDHYGYRGRIMILGSILMTLSHSLLAFTSIHPLVAIVIMGISFSAVPAAIWPSVAIFIDENDVGTAYGFLGVVQNAGLWGVPILIGKITDWTNPGVTTDMVNRKLAVWDYSGALILLTAFAFISVISAMMIRKTAKPGSEFFLPGIKK